MKNTFTYQLVKGLIFIIDFCLIYLPFLMARKLGLIPGFSHDQFITFFLIFILLWVIAGFWCRIYRLHSRSLMRSISINLFNAFLVHLLLILTITKLLNIYQGVSYEFLAFIYITSMVSLIGIRVAYKLFSKYIEFSGFDHRNVVIVGVTRPGRSLYDFFSSHHGEGYIFKGFFSDTEEVDADLKDEVVGNTHTLKDFCLKENIDEIYFALPLSHEELLKDISRFADDHFIYFRLAPDFSPVIQEEHNVFMVNSNPVLTTRKNPLESWINAFLKRSFDIVFSLAVIFFLFPIVFPIIALAIRLDSEGPIFFKQLRPGKKNKLFDCYKFRTMRVNNTTEVQATRNDARITRVGRFLRKSNLDELPQFFNVLLGNMSVVGPRPNMISQLEEYSKSIAHYQRRHFVTPGITGYAQVKGFRGETRELNLMEKRIKYDELYMQNWSLLLDVKIIFLTVWNMVKGNKHAF